MDQQLYDQYGLTESEEGSDSDFLDEKLDALKLRLKKKKAARAAAPREESSYSS